MRITIRLTDYEETCLADIEASMPEYTRSQVVRALITRTHGDLVRSGAIARLRRQAKRRKNSRQKELFNER